MDFWLLSVNFHEIAVIIIVGEIIILLLTRQYLLDIKVGHLALVVVYVRVGRHHLEVLFGDLGAVFAFEEVGVRLQQAS